MTKDRTSGAARADSDGASTLDLSGRRVGSSYILKRPIGQGATGTVWHGEDLSTGEPVAVKLLHESLLRQPKLVTRFVQERTILLMLRHRNVVRVRDLFSVGETLGLVMDLVGGGSLRDHLRTHRTVPPGEAARLAAQVAAALAEAHELGVVHRDLKPDNILLQTVDGRLETRLTDFGVARILNTPSMTTPNAVVGTPHYMSPEAFHSATPSPATDVYALGVLLYELVSGRPPYDSDVIPELMRRHMGGEPERRPGIPDALWDVIMACMALKPRLRPSAAELVADLSDVAQQTGDVPALPAPSGATIDPNAVGARSVQEPPEPRPAASITGVRAEAEPQSVAVANSKVGAAPAEPAPDSIIGVSRPPEQRHNRVPSRRWARPGVTMTLVAAVLVSAAATAAAWKFGRPDGDPRANARPRVHATPTVKTPARRPAPRAVSTPTSGQPRPAPGDTAVPVRLDPTPTGVRARRPAPVDGTSRSPEPEAQPYGPWQCTPSFAFDMGTRIPLGPKPCQMTGQDIRYQASLTAPGGATGSISISLLDTASGRTAAGPKTCSGLAFTGDASTASCGPAPASPQRGRQYAVVMSYRYERGGHTVSSTAKGGPFTW